MIVCWRRLCLTVAVRSLGFLIGQSVRVALLRAAPTVGTSAHTTYGEDIKHGKEKASNFGQRLT
jgi:hypothetical protein